MEAATRVSDTSEMTLFCSGKQQPSSKKLLSPDRNKPRGGGEQVEAPAPACNHQMESTAVEGHVHSYSLAPPHPWHFCKDCGRHWGKKL